MRRLRPRFTERGLALPMALITMLILAALMLAFLSLSTSEPQIASNHLSKTQARAQAEGGVERTIWALSNPTDSAGLTNPLPSTLPSPYNGATLVSLGVGGYTVSVASGAVSNEKTVTSTGWVPNNVSPRAKQVITATLTSLRDFNLDLPCALCVKGSLDASGNAEVDARPSSSCAGPAKVGTYTTGATTGFGTGARHVYGADGNNTADQSTDYTQSADPAGFDAFTLTSDELSTLKSIAKANNAYYQGAVTFGTSNPLPNGVVFVDTTTGNNITNSTPTSEYGAVTITGADASGWLIINGSLTINGNVAYRGMVYVQDGISYRGTGSGGGIQGAVVAHGVADVTSDVTGNSQITYNCDYVTNGNNTVPTGWFIKPGSWREVEG